MAYHLLTNQQKGEGYMDWNVVWNILINWVMNTGIKIVIALLVLFISFRIITLVTRRFTKKLVDGKHKADKTIVSTLMYVLGVALKVVIVISLIGYVGIDRIEGSYFTIMGLPVHIVYQELVKHIG
jgi:small-conductance mechanosensitive channel